MECMPQFETQVPDPLRQDLPELLAPRWYESTTGLRLAPDLHQRARTQTLLDADRDPPHRQE